MLSDRIDREVIEAAPGLKIIANYAVGYNNIDLEAAAERKIAVTNTPGVLTETTADLTFALMLAAGRRLAEGEGLVRSGKWAGWAPTQLLGTDLYGKTLGIVGMGRIGQAVAQRAAGFSMPTVYYSRRRLPLSVEKKLHAAPVSFSRLLKGSDFLSLHLPLTPDSRHLIDRKALQAMKPSAFLINTSRGAIVDEPALIRALAEKRIAGAGLDVFEEEPPTDWSIAQHPRVVATPHIAGSTSEAQELVGIDVAIGVREFLLHGVVRNAVNFPSVPAEEFSRLQPFMTLAERLGQLAAQLTDGAIHTVGVRYYGALANGPSELTTGSVLVGLFRRVLSSGVTLINARALAGDRGLEVTETRSSRPRTFANLISVKAHTPQGEHWVEGTVFGNDSPRVTSVDGVSVEAALEGTLLIIRNDDQPGVIGEVGTRLGRHGVNIATFALGRSASGAVGVVSVDEGEGAAISQAVLDDIRKAPHVRSVTVARIL